MEYLDIVLLRTSVLCRINLLRRNLIANEGSDTSYWRYELHKANELLEKLNKCVQVFGCSSVD